LKKSNPKNRNLQKTSPKNKQISIKTSPKTSNPQVFKKNPQLHKKQGQIGGKTARLATLQQMRGMGLKYGTEITPQTDSESWHRSLKRCF